MNVDMRLRGTKGMDGGPDKKGNAAEYGEGHVLSTVCVCTMRKDRTQQNSFPMLGITPRAFLMPGSICCQAIPSPALYFASNSSSSLEYCLEAKVTEGREKGRWLWNGVNISCITSKLFASQGPRASATVMFTQAYLGAFSANWFTGFWFPSA